MKKLFVIMVVVALVFTLCSCKKSNNITDGSFNDESSLTTSGNDTSSTSNISEKTSKKTGNTGRSTVSNSTTSNDATFEPFKSVSKTQNNADSDKINDILASKPVRFTADISRAPSTDVGSVVSNGYIYYTNMYSYFPSALFRKKISGGDVETVSDLDITQHQVLDETIYYLSESNLYRCDTDGSNAKKLYDNIGKFWVAGKWIFAVRNGEHTVIGLPREELYIISTDGSVVKPIKPDVSNEAGSTVKMYGFNRGYCYVTVNHYYYLKDRPNPTYTGKSLNLRIDYRSKELTQQKLVLETEYVYEGSKWYDVYFNGTDMIMRDHLVQSSSDKVWLVSLADNTAFTAYTSTCDLDEKLLKDYLVYIPEESTVNNYKVVFVNYNGEKKTCTFDFSDTGATHCELHRYQDVNSNSLLLDLRFNDATSEGGAIVMVDSNGKVTEIYKQIKQKQVKQ